MARRKPSARDLLRSYFLEHVGEVVDTKDLKRVAGISDYQRRIRELREEEGYRILSHHDRADLKPGQYLLESAKPDPAFTREISPQQRARILARNGYTCQICGAGPGDPDPLDPRRRVRLHVDHIVPISEGGTNDDSNLRVTCSTCNQGRSNLDLTPDERAINLMGRIRRAPRDVQQQIYEWLRRKFEPPSDV